MKAGSDLMQYNNMVKLQHQSGWCHASIILPLLGVAMPEGTTRREHLRPNHDRENFWFWAASGRVCS